MNRIAASLAALLLVAACGDAPHRVAPLTSGTPATSAAEVTTSASPVSGEPQQCTVPDVVGMIHQTTMQAAGLYALRDVDGSGQNRPLKPEREWRTTAQSVNAGQVVDCNTEIALIAKKLDD